LIPPESNRNESWNQLRQGELDLLVIGGGIVGSGVARDAAMRGLKTALVDQGDFASGTSSRSSRLLHGGLRYLEQGRIGLVREASVEKKILHQIAPHLAQPLGFIFPAYKRAGRPLWQLRLGVKLYDFLCGSGNFEPSRGLSKSETEAQLPELKTENLTGSVQYFDALTNDARLVIDTLRSAQAHGAFLLNYTQFKNARWVNSSWHCEIENNISGPATIRARTIVNATGPWADKIPHSSVRLRLTKGIHIVIDRNRLTVPSAVVITEGKRILFILPWGDRVIIGTTDTPYSGPPENVSTDPTDLKYLLGIVNEFFPSTHLESTDILATWAGVRPLIATSNESAASPSEISRAHQIRMPEPGWWDIAGGKLTTYRLMAEQAVDQIVKHLGRNPAPSRTAHEGLLRPDQVTPFSGIQPPPITRESVEHYVRKEWALHLNDVLLRRSGWAYYNSLSREQVESIASWIAPELQWTDGQRRAEVADFLKQHAIPIS
jgi:glycerol-3-phosphate dehydrogenase